MSGHVGGHVSRVAYTMGIPPSLALPDSFTKLNLMISKPPPQPKLERGPCVLPLLPGVSRKLLSRDYFMVLPTLGRLCM